jgi:hypothetical protein
MNKSTQVVQTIATSFVTHSKDGVYVFNKLNGAVLIIQGMSYSHAVEKLFNNQMPSDTDLDMEKTIFPTVYVKIVNTENQQEMYFMFSEKHIVEKGINTVDVLVEALNLDKQLSVLYQREKFSVDVITYDACEGKQVTALGL